MISHHPVAFSTVPAWLTDSESIAVDLLSTILAIVYIHSPSIVAAVAATADQFPISRIAATSIPVSADSLAIGSLDQPKSPNFLVLAVAVNLVDL